MYVCMYVYTHAHTHTLIYTVLYIYIYIYIFVLLIYAPYDAGFPAGRRNPTSVLSAWGYTLRVRRGPDSCAY